MIIKKKVGETGIPNKAPEEKKVVNAPTVEEVVNNEDHSEKAFIEYLREILNDYMNGEKGLVHFREDIPPVNKISDTEYSFRYAITSNVILEQGWAGDYMEVEQPRDFLEDKFAYLINTFDTDNRLKNSFIALYKTNTPILMVFAVDTFYKVICNAFKAFDIKDKESLSKVVFSNEFGSMKSAIFVRMVQFMSMFGMISKTDPELFIPSKDFDHDWKYYHGPFMLLLPITTNEVEPQVIQKLVADKLPLETIAASIDAFSDFTRQVHRSFSAFGDFSQKIAATPSAPAAYAAFDNLTMGYVNIVDILIKNLEKDDLDPWLENLNKSVLFISHILEGYSSGQKNYHNIANVTQGQWQMVIAALTSHLNEHPDQDLFDAFDISDDQFNNEYTHDLVFDYIDWIGFVHWFTLKRKEELDAFEEKFNYDVSQVLASIHFFVEILNIQINTAKQLFRKNRVFFMYAPIETIAIMLRVMDVREIPNIAANAEMLRAQNLQFTTMEFCAPDGIPLHYQEKINEVVSLGEFNKYILDITLFNGQNVPFAGNLRSLDDVGKICIAANLYNNGYAFNGQLLF